MSKFARLAFVGAAITLPIAAYAVVVRPWSQRWGVDPDEGAAPLPGDDLIADPTGQVTRGITVAAAPMDVWPWLVQMGIERGGWYSYDQLDMRGRSVRTIHPEWQSLAVGDVVPTWPGGGFEVRAIEPGRSLSLYLDSNIVRAQAEAQAQANGGPADMPGGMAVSSAMMGTQPKEFAASWSFVAEPTPEGDTRLIERVRFHYPPQPYSGRMATDAFGFGVFLMMRKQMLGIRERAEALAGSKLPAAAEPRPTGDATTHAGMLGAQA